MQGLVGSINASQFRSPSLLILSETSHSTRDILMQLKVAVGDGICVAIIAYVNNNSYHGRDFT